MKKDVVSQLREYAKDHEAAARICEWLSGLTNSYNVTPIRVIAQRSGVDYYEAVEVMKALGELGLGRFWNGRKGKESRFEWWVNRGEIGRAALGQIDEIELIDADFEDEEHDEHDPMKIVRLHQKLLSMALRTSPENIQITIHQ